MKKKDFLEFIITDQELRSAPLPCVPGQLLMSILKEKGAPITGTVFLTLEKGWLADTMKEPMTYLTRVRFFKKEIT